MKKRFLLLGLLGLFSFGAVALVGNDNFRPVYAEEEAATYTISYSQPKHGEVLIAEEDLTGEVGKEVEININPDMFYLINSVSVNGSALVESEETKGLYTFTPVAGENVVVVDIVLNEALLTEFNTLAQEVKNKDWANIFTPDFVIRIISACLNSGLLIAIVAYFIKDKKLSKKVEDKVGDVLEAKITPELKENVAVAVKDMLNGPFNELTANNLRIMQGMAVFSKCFALMQENTPESRRAIIDELTSLEIGDMKTLQDIKDYIEKEVAKKQKIFEDNLKKLQEIKEANSVVSNEEPKEETHTEDKEYDGTEI